MSDAFGLFKDDQGLFLKVLIMEKAGQNLIAPLCQYAVL